MSMTFWSKGPNLWVQEAKITLKRDIVLVQGTNLLVQGTKIRTEKGPISLVQGTKLFGPADQLAWSPNLKQGPN